MLLIKTDVEQLHTMAMAFLRFLVVDQKQELYEAIGILDGFPNEEQFEELRMVLYSAKYQNRVFSLRDEIEWFLSVKKHRIERLISLREQVGSIHNSVSTECSIPTAKLDYVNNLMKLSDILATNSCHRRRLSSEKFTQAFTTRVDSRKTVMRVLFIA